MKIIVGCGATKLKIPCPAYKLYVGGYFRATIQWAASVTPRSSVFILSAKYGLIPCDRMIEPYDSVMGTKTQIITPAEVRSQVNELGLDREIPLLASLGSAYRKVLEPALPRFHRLIDHMGLSTPGMGRQMSWYTKNKGRLPPSLAALYSVGVNPK